MKNSLIITLLMSISSMAIADCTGVIALPLSMQGGQNQLQWSGIVGAYGGGSAISTCSSNSSPYDYRYNIISTSAICRNVSSSISYVAPLTTLSADIATGPLQKLRTMHFNGQLFDIWGALYKSPSNTLPVTGPFGGSYSTKVMIDIQSLPAGSYSCSVKNTHSAYGSNSPGLVLGVDKVFNYATSLGDSGWAQGSVNVTVNIACSIPDSVALNHGTVTTGMKNTKREKISIQCNKNASVTASLRGSGDLFNGVTVDVGPSKSILGVSSDGVIYDKEAKINVISNVAAHFFLKSELDAKGSGSQSGSAVATILYN